MSLRGAAFVQVCDEHPNVRIKCSLSRELHDLARYHQKSPYNLVSPQLATLSRLLVSNIVSRPSMLQEFCRFISVASSDFIEQTLDDTLALVVCNRDHSCLSKIAGALHDKSPAALLLNHAGSILPKVFLLASTADTDRVLGFMVEEMSRNSKPQQRIEDADIVRSCLVRVICDLVCELGNDNKDMRHRVLHAFDDSLALIDRQSASALKKLERKIATTGNPARLPPASDLGKFLSIHVLGILNNINDLLHDMRGRKPVADKKKWLRSIGALIQLIGASISQVSNQVRRGLFAGHTNAVVDHIFR